jgi:hypothetical protein
MFHILSNQRPPPFQAVMIDECGTLEEWKFAGKTGGFERNLLQFHVGYPESTKITLGLTSRPP